MNVATNLSKALGINITLIRDNLGGYKNDEDTQLRELSYTIEFDEVDAESAKLFASLLSDLGYQVQESVFSLTYLDVNATDCTGTEYFIKCDTSDRHKVADALEKAGFEDYTINADGVQILDFKKQETDQNSNDKQSLTVDNTDTSTNKSNFADTVEALSKTLSGTLSWQKFNSDYLGVEDRKQLYKEILNKIQNGQQTKSLPSQNAGISVGITGEERSTHQGYQGQLSDYINEALKNLQSFQQGQRGEDLTNDLQNGEEEYTLNTPLTPTQLARSQLDAEGDSMSSEEDQVIQQHQETFLQQISNLLTTTVLTQAQIMQFAKDVGNVMIDCLNQCLSLSPEKLKKIRQ